MSKRNKRRLRKKYIYIYVVESLYVMLLKSELQDTLGLLFMIVIYVSSRTIYVQ